MPVAIFDLDGTLHDRARGVRGLASAHAAALCAGPSMREHFCARFQELDDHGKVWKDRVYDQLRTPFGSPAWPPTDVLVQSYITDFPRFAMEMPGATDVLKLLKRQGVRTAVITNGRSDLQRSVIKALGFHLLVDSIVVSEEVGFRKPQPQIFKIVLDAVACRPEDAVMIGDDPVADLEGAQSVGIQPIGFRCAVESAPAVLDLASAGVEILTRLRRAG